MSIGWEEDSGFLQGGMESRVGTMGPGTASSPKSPIAEESRLRSPSLLPFAVSSRQKARPAGS